MVLAVDKTCHKFSLDMLDTALIWKEYIQPWFVCVYLACGPVTRGMTKSLGFVSTLSKCTFRDPEKVTERQNSDRNAPNSTSKGLGPFDPEPAGRL